MKPIPSVMLLLVALPCLFAMSHAQHLQGRLSQNANLYKLLTFPVDPNYAEFEFSGNPNYGQAVMRFRGPGDLCLQWPNVTAPICGRQANDYRVVVQFDQRQASLLTLTNLLSNQSFGNSSDMVVVGRWEARNHVLIELQHQLRIFRSPVNFATVVLTQTVAGHLTRRPRREWHFDGYASLLATSYVVGQQQPFQVVTSLGQVQSDQLNVATPFAAMSPYPTQPNTNPAAPVYAVGNLTNIHVQGNVLTADVSFKTPNLRIQVERANMTAVVRQDDRDDRVIHVVHARLIDLDQVHQAYFMDHFDILLND